jgi:uncharacterized membrane protein
MPLNPPSPAAPQSLSEHIDQNIESVIALQKRQWESAGPAQQRVERVGQFIGRPAYLVFLLIAILLWVAFNLLGAGRMVGWDPPPFELLDGIMTFVSLMTTTIVLIAQNRQTQGEQQHAQLALQVSLITEQKVTKLIRLMEELRRDMPMVKDRHDPQAEALQESADTTAVVAALDEVEGKQE